MFSVKKTKQGSAHDFVLTVEDPTGQKLSVDIYDFWASDFQKLVLQVLLGLRAVWEESFGLSTQRIALELVDEFVIVTIVEETTNELLKDKYPKEVQSIVEFEEFCKQMQKIVGDGFEFIRNDVVVVTKVYSDDQSTEIECMSTAKAFARLAENMTDGIDGLETIGGKVKIRIYLGFTRNANCNITFEAPEGSCSTYWLTALVAYFDANGWHAGKAFDAFYGTTQYPVNPETAFEQFIRTRPVA